MNESNIYQCIRQVLADAPCNQYTAELHLQMIKYADEL
ncbi:HTH-like domain-containing protein [Pokkaliibacter plantistimulans]